MDLDIDIKSCDKCCFNLCPFSAEYQCDAPMGPIGTFEPIIGARHKDCPLDKYGEIRVHPDKG